MARMIELAILGLLDEHDLHGYELRKRLSELPGMPPAVSFGSLYPALGRLERAGQVKAVTSSPEVVMRSPSMSGSLDGELAAFRRARREASRSDAQPTRRHGRAKKVYGITDTGRERLHELLTELDVSDDRDFAGRVAFCDRLTPSERLWLFQRRRAELVGRRNRRRAAARSIDTDSASASGSSHQRRNLYRPGLINRYRRSLLERDIEAITADLAWLDRMIDNERAASGSENGGNS